MNVVLYYNIGADHFIDTLGEELTSFLNSPKLGLATAVRLFEVFKDSKISQKEKTFVRKCLDELVFGIIEGDLVKTNVYMEVMMSVFIFLL